MTKIEKILAAGVLVAIVIALGTLLGGHKSSVGAISPTDGSASNFTELTASAGLAVGSSQQFQISSAGVMTLGTSGTAINRLNRGICFIKPYATTITASSSATVDCQGTAAVGSITGAASALTGVAFGDSVNVTLSTTTASGGSLQGTVLTAMGLSVVGASASTTSGYITLIIANGTGATYTWPITGSATGTASYTAGN